MLTLKSATPTAIATALVVAAVGVDVLLSACGGRVNGPHADSRLSVGHRLEQRCEPDDFVGPGGGERSLTQINDEVFVSFNNSDTVAHDIRSDPHPAHTNCPALNVEAVAAGRTMVTPILNQCLRGTTQQTYHDETRPDDVRFQGRIRRQR